MSPRTTKTTFMLFGGLLLLLFAGSIWYVVALLLNAGPHLDVDLSYGFSYAKIGIDCDKITHPPPGRGPTLGDILVAGFVGQTWAHHMAVTAVFVLVGLLAYLCRCRAQVLYGFLEIFAAVGFAATFLYSINVQNVRLFSATVGLLGAIYVVARGLDNIEKGLAILPEFHQCWRRFWFGPPLGS